jgi:hypothetical protein
MDRVEEIPLRVTPVLSVPISGVAGIRIPVRPGVLSDFPFRRVRPGLIDPGPVALEMALDRGLVPEVMPGARHSSHTGLMRAVATVPPGAMPKDMAAMGKDRIETPRGRTATAIAAAGLLRHHFHRKHPALQAVRRFPGLRPTAPIRLLTTPGRTATIADPRVIRVIRVIRVTRVTRVLVERIDGARRDRRGLSGGVRRVRGVGRLMPASGLAPHGPAVVLAPAVAEGRLNRHGCRRRSGRSGRPTRAGWLLIFC